LLTREKEGSGAVMRNKARRAFALSRKTNMVTVSVSDDGQDVLKSTELFHRKQKGKYEKQI
jgi:hypothetical protein